jgi:hypothetical protein
MEMTEALKTMETLEGIQGEEVVNNFEAEIKKLIPTAGTLTLSEREREILYRPIDETRVEIRPDGLIFLPWTEYQTRLKDVFGLSWMLLPVGMPKQHGDLILWTFYLAIRGKLCGCGIGEQQYRANNAQMSWGDAVEGAKSNALTRLCKSIGLFTDLWRPAFVNEWKERYAEKYWDVQKGKFLWRKNPIESVHVQHTETGTSGRFPYGEAYERFSRQPERYTQTGEEAKPSGNGRVSQGDLMEKIQNTATLEDLKDVWRTYYHYLEAFSPEDKDNILVAKDRRKQEFIAKNERGFFNGRK